jgi:1,4-alpha-glucan branching enzyme
MTARKKRVEFRILAPEAEKVLLSGDFNEWSERSDPMKRDVSGTWKKAKMLPQGRHEYKFMVDGEWRLDPNCRETVPNQYGTENNVIEI